VNLLFNRRGRLAEAEDLGFCVVSSTGQYDVRGGQLSWQPFIKFDIFGSFSRLVGQRGRTKGFKGIFFMEKSTPKSGTEVDRGTYGTGAWVGAGLGCGSMVLA
jgi:hypothetical protein